MSAIQTILVAVDQSEYSVGVMRFAADIARAVGAQIAMVNIYNQRDINAVKGALNAYYDPDFFEKVVEENITHRHAEMARLAADIGATDLIKDKMVRIGVPYEQILAVIEEIKPDLLVMGTKGRGALADTIVGSCAQKLYRRSPVPLLSVRVPK